MTELLEPVTVQVAVDPPYPVVIGTGGAVLITMGVLMWTGEFTQLNITVSNWLQSIGLPNLNGDT